MLKNNHEFPRDLAPGANLLVFFPNVKTPPLPCYIFNSLCIVCLDKRHYLIATAFRFSSSKAHRKRETTFIFNTRQYWNTLILLSNRLFSPRSPSSFVHNLCTSCPILGSFTSFPVPTLLASSLHISAVTWQHGPIWNRSSHVALATEHTCVCGKHLFFGFVFKEAPRTWKSNVCWDLKWTIRMSACS